MSSETDASVALPRERSFELAGRDERRTPIQIVVVAASAGGIAALRRVLGALPADLPVPVAIVQHRSTQQPNLIATVLGRWSRLPVRLVPAEGTTVEPGVIYVAPPDRHLVVAEARSFATFDGQRIRHLRSSANPLFASAAAVHGAGVLAVVLTGGDSDATDGVQTVKAAGGTVIVQDPATCANPGMPTAAVATGVVDLVLPLDAIGPAITELVTRSRA